MESSRAAARQALLDAIKQLEVVVPTAQMNTPITLHAVTPHLQEFETTFGREVSLGAHLEYQGRGTNSSVSSGLQAFIAYTIGQW